MADNASFLDLMHRLRAGEEQEATDIFQRFAGLLVARARSRLERKIRQKTEPEDVVLSAFKSFFLRFQGGKFAVTSWDSLEGLLVVITLRKCGRVIRHFHGSFHDVRKEVSGPESTDGPGAAWEAIAREPTPAEAAELADTLERVMCGLDARDRRILELRLEGHKAREISALVALTEFTVQGVLKKIQKRLKGMRDENAQAQ